MTRCEPRHFVSVAWERACQINQTYDIHSLLRLRGFHSILHVELNPRDPRETFFFFFSWFWVVNSGSNHTGWLGPFCCLLWLSGRHADSLNLFSYVKLLVIFSADRARSAF